MKSNKALARKILCGLLAAGVVGVSGSALAGDTITTSKHLDGDVFIKTDSNWAAVVQSTGSDTIKITGDSFKLGLETSASCADAIDCYDTAGKIILGDTNTNDISISCKATNQAFGIWALKKSYVEVNAKQLSIEVYGNDARAIQVQNNSVPGDKKTDFATVILNANTVIKSDGIGIAAMSEGRFTANGDIEITAPQVIVARGDAIVKINEDGKHTTKLDGDMSFNYDKATSGTKVDADVLVNLTGYESYWNGNSKVTWGTGAIPAGLEKVTGIDLRINDGATWNPTYVEEADKGDYGTAVLAQNRVTLDGGNIDLTNAKNQQVKIETLAGDNGTIKIGSEYNSLAVTKDNKANNLTVAATQQYAEKIASNDMSTAVNDLASKVKDETNPNADGDSKTAASRVYIPETTVTGAVTADIDKNGNAANVKEAVNTTNAAVSDLASISLMTWRQENNDMNKRLGELRDSKGEHGAWARMARGESKYGAQNVKNQYNYYQVGYDEKLSTNPNWTVGVALTRTEGNSTFATGTGENKHTGFALYGSYLGDNGSFIDLIAKYARLDNEFNATAGIGNGDYKTNGYSLSAEYGKRFTKDNGFWIEPQVELTYGTVGSVDYLTSKGANVHQDGMDSLVGRLGFSLGKNIKQGNVYVRASYLYDFDGDTKAIYTKEDVARSFEQDLGGGWWEVGVGTNLNLSDATHLYFDVEKTYGGNVATPWQWNAGVRWNF
jgi:outer membrane autotransporter protein